MPLDPLTGRQGKAIPVDDPHDSASRPTASRPSRWRDLPKLLDFGDPRTMALQCNIHTLGCPGIHHADFYTDGRFAIFTCDFSGTLSEIDLAGRKVLVYVQPKMPAIRFKEVLNEPRSRQGRFGSRAAQELHRHARHAARHPHLAGWQTALHQFLHRRAACRRCAHRQRREPHAAQLYPDRVGRARPVPQPRRQMAVCCQPRLALDPRLPGCPQPGRYSVGHTGDMR